MHLNHIRQNVNDALPLLARELMTCGAELGSRNGTVKELMHVGTTLHRPWQREILLPERKAYLAAQIFETMWVLGGRNDVASLSKYLPRAKDFSDDGVTWRGGYGPRLRKWAGIDQLAHVVEMLRANPLDRRAVIALYDPVTDTEPGKDIPCNNWLSFSSRLGKLDLHVAIRSNDLIWGWSGINAFEWSALQEVVAGMLGMQVGALHFSTTSLHVYSNHWKKARALATATPPGGFFDSPRFDIGSDRSMANLDQLIEDWFLLEYEIRTGADAQSSVEAFPEPMMQSWLRVLQWWWSGGNKDFLAPLVGTRLYEAARVGIRPTPQVETPKPMPWPTSRPAPSIRDLIEQSGWEDEEGSDFIGHAIMLHIGKDKAYGTSWKKRGELFSIIPNIARKVDRLGNPETEDETSADTAEDLMVYLAKYRVWLSESPGTLYSHGTAWVNALLRVVDHELSKHMERVAPAGYQADLEAKLKANFDILTDLVENGQRDEVPELVSEMLRDAYRLARFLWGKGRG